VCVLHAYLSSHANVEAEHALHTCSLRVSQEAVYDLPNDRDMALQNRIQTNDCCYHHVQLCCSYKNAVHALAHCASIRLGSMIKKKLEVTNAGLANVGKRHIHLQELRPICRVFKTLLYTRRVFVDRRVAELPRCRQLDYSKKVRVTNNSTSRLDQYTSSCSKIRRKCRIFGVPTLTFLNEEHTHTHKRTVMASHVRPKSIPWCDVTKLSASCKSLPRTSHLYGLSLV